jgi:hypothetical protein
MNNYKYRVQLNNTTCNSPAPSNVATLTVNALPIVTWTNALAPQCANATTYALTGGTPAGGTYKGTGVTGSNFNASVAGIGTFTLKYIYTNANGCIDSNTNTIVVNAYPVLTLTAAPYTRLLPGYTTTITATMSTGPAFTSVWTYNTAPLVNSTNSYLVDVDKLGTYTVVGTTPQGCISLPASITILDSASSRLFIYPSPNDGRFRVAYHNPGGATVKQGFTIYDAAGRTVYNTTYTISQAYKNIDVDLRRYGAGVYYLVLRDANGKKIKTGEVMVR